MNWFYLSLLLAIGIIYTLGSLANPALFFIATSLLACLIMIWRIEDPVLRTIIIAALGVRLSLALVQAFTAVDLPGAGADAKTFEHHGWKNAQAWIYDGEAEKTTGAYYFSSYIGIIYIFFGRVLFIPKLINIYFSLLSVYMLYRTVNMVTATKFIGLVAALLLTVLPTINVFSAVLLRETLIIFLLLLSFYLLICWMQKGKMIFFAGSFLALVLAGMLHGAMFLVFAVHLLFLFIYSPSEQKFKLMYWQLIPAALFVTLAFLLVGNIITYMLPDNLIEIFTPERLGRMVERKTVGRTVYLEGLVPSSYFDLVWQTPVRVFYFLFAPFPWAVVNLKDLVNLLENLYYAVLIYFACLGSRLLWGKKKHVVISTLLIAASLVVMFAWGTANYGTAWRHKQKVAPFIIVLASTGVASNLRLRRMLIGDRAFLLGRDHKSSIEDISKGENPEPFGVYLAEKVDPADG